MTGYAAVTVRRIVFVLFFQKSMQVLITRLAKRLQLFSWKQVVTKKVSKIFETELITIFLKTVWILFEYRNLKHEFIDFNWVNSAYKFITYQKKK